MIHIFSTELKSGKGGISTALVGYVESLRERDVPINLVTTHSGVNKVGNFFKALASAFRVKSGDVCWFHVGPWFSILRKSIFILICKLKGAKVVVHFHSAKTHHYLHSSFGRLCLKCLYFLSDHFVVLTNWWKSEFAHHGFDEKVFVSPNPIDSQLVQLIEENKVRFLEGKKLEETAFVNILAMTRLVEGKGFREIINALHILPSNYKLSIAGSGPLEEQLKKQVQALGLSDRVTFLGWVDYGSKLELFSNTDLFCLPSRFDSFGMVYLEALSANIPVVALNFQAIPDVVPEGMGVLIDNDDPVSLACAIQEAAEIRDIKGDEYVLSKYSPEPVTKRFLKNVEYSA